ncbi:Protein REVEILLE 6 [Zea mays]|uniref:Protein REVEILLE 6 n=1 Tax=Zea mays TaxID=4577 RepID=A0A1D6HFZ2_MAIZE|nr:Protein REVEILLE 6 [Zea mays]
MKEAFAPFVLLASSMPSADDCVRLSALILPYFSTLKGIFCPGQRDSLPYTKIICSHIYPISLLYTNHYNFYFQFNIPPSLVPWREMEPLATCTKEKKIG